MWRLLNADDGRRAHSIIVPHGSKAAAGWFCQGIPQESRDFPTWHHALCWLEEKRATLESYRWHEEDPPEE